MSCKYGHENCDCACTKQPENAAWKALHRALQGVQTSIRQLQFEKGEKERNIISQQKSQAELEQAIKVLETKPPAVCLACIEALQKYGRCCETHFSGE